MAIIMEILNLWKKKKRQAKESTEDVDNQLHMHTNIGINIIPLKTFRGNHLSFFFWGGEGGGEREREREREREIG